MADVPARDRLDELTVDDVLQMCSAPSDSFSAGEWCHAANVLASEREALVEVARAAREARKYVHCVTDPPCGDCGACRFHAALDGAA